MHKKNTYKILIIFLFSFLIKIPLISLIRNVVESVRVIKVNSIKQEITDSNKILLEDNVEILIDDKIHIWADIVKINKDEKKLVASKIDNSSIVIETPDLLMLADSLFFNLNSKTGTANNLRVHVAQGYVYAKSAKKIDSDHWEMEDIIFTPCDAHIPHWSITARGAVLYKNYLLRFSGLLFKVGPIPFFILPYMALPLQKRSKSGFLIPKFSYDNDLGIGLRQEFYLSIASRLDSTVSFDWREKKGLAFVDEFRWIRSKESFTLFDVSYALEKNAFVKKRDRIEQKTDHRYWIDGKDFRSFESVFDKRFNSLLRIDFGTDKKIGYQFFDNFLRVDNIFYNSWILRFVRNSNFNHNDVFNFYFDSTKVSKSRFSSLSNLEKQDLHRLLTSDDIEYLDSSQKEIEDKLFIIALPHLEWNSDFKKFFNLFSLRQDLFVDHVFSRKKKQDRFYVNSKVVKEGDEYYLAKADTFRFFYNLNLNTKLKFKDQFLFFNLDPNFQIRTNVKDKNQTSSNNDLEIMLFNNINFRGFLKGDIEWVMPELFFETSNTYNYYVQPSIKWDFLPKFKQNHWYHSDKWDRYYPTNKFEFNVNNRWNIDNAFIDLNITQAVDFYNSSDRFYLERTPEQKHLFPLNLELGVDCDVLNLFLKQEYEWKNLQLLSNQFNISFSLNDFQLYFATVYQNKKLQIQRALFSDITNFLILSFTVPLIKNAKLSYDGQFYSEKKSSIFPVQGFKPLQHVINLEYKGHCWGISLGYEEKRYKEFGNWKSDKAYTLFIRLKSLGSFARKFKIPSTVNYNM